MTSRPAQIADNHLRRTGVVYLRQSSEAQVRENTGSTAMQRDLGNMLEAWGWRPEHIELRDGDLGRSGSIPGLRPDFSALIDDMKVDKIGLVAVTDISRLARNELEWAVFAISARQHDVLLAIGHTVVDFRDPNSAFATGVLGLNAGRENLVRIAQSRLAKRKKVEAGMALTRPPFGYIRGEKGAWLKDPDPRVREVIQLIFDKFLELGSARAVYRYLRVNGYKLPSASRRHRSLR